MSAKQATKPCSESIQGVMIAPERVNVRLRFRFPSNLRVIEVDVLLLTPQEWAQRPELHDRRVWLAEMLGGLVLVVQRPVGLEG